jgi:dolichol kinase
LTNQQQPQRPLPGPSSNGIDRKYENEVIRKAIHLSSIAIPLFVFFTSRELSLAVFLPLTVIFAGLDIARYYHRPLGEMFYRTFGRILRKHERDSEKKTLNGATYLLIASTLCIIIFPKFIAVTSLIILIISDMTSALIGRRFGRHKFLGKSLEGSFGFFLSAAVVVALTPKLAYLPGEYVIGIVAGAVGAVAEALSIAVDDNLTIPLSVGTVMWCAYALFYPALDLYHIG